MPADDAYAAIEHNAYSLCRWLKLPEDTPLTWQTIAQGGATRDGDPVDGQNMTFAAAPDRIADECRRLCRDAAFPNLYFTWGLFDPPHKRVVDTCQRVLALVMDCDACDWMAATEYQADLWEPDVDDRGVEDGDAQGLHNAKVEAIKPLLWTMAEEELHDLLDYHREVLDSHLREIGLPASSIIRSGYGHYAIFRLTAGGDQVADCRDVNRRLVATLNDVAGFELADPACVDAGTRILRMIGAYNVKHPRFPRRCRAMSADGPSYTLDEIAAALPAPAKPAPQPAPQPAPLPRDAGQSDDGRLSDPEIAERALAILDPDCAYQDWLRVGMILHDLGLPVEVWDAWSSRGSKYEEGCCTKKWPGFGRGTTKATIGTLIEMVRQKQPDFLTPGSRRHEFAEQPQPAAERQRHDQPARSESPAIPMALDSESIVLGTVAFHGLDGFALVDGIIRAEHFYDDGHRAVAASKDTARELDVPLSGVMRLNHCGAIEHVGLRPASARRDPGWSCSQPDSHSGRWQSTGPWQPDRGCVSLQDGHPEHGNGPVASQAATLIPPRCNAR